MTQTDKSAPIKDISEQIVEIVSDSGEGAQTAGQMFGTVCAKMGNSVWTVEIIPAEIEPPARSREGASGNRIRFASHKITNMGDEADLVVCFNEQVLYSRIDNKALRKGTKLIFDKVWGEHDLPEIREAYKTALAEFKESGYEIIEAPMEEETLKFTDNPRRGKNMWVVGMLCAIYDRDLSIVLDEITNVFTKKRKQHVIGFNHELVKAGYQWGLENWPQRLRCKPWVEDKKMVVMNGNQAVAVGSMAAGFELCSMYPITPATSCTHYMASRFHQTGGFIHQAEDEIAACGFAVGASYAGKTALTITSGPGMALKTEMIGLAIMCEVPLVIVDVQRGGPSTGLPTKVEQGDLLHSYFAHTGDAPKVIMAPATIDECFSMMIDARQIAEAFRTPVIVLTDANLATGQTSFEYPEPREEWLSPPVDQSPWEKGKPPYDWSKEKPVSPRPIPGQPDGMYVLTGLAHDERSKIAYASAKNQHGMEMRSRKLAEFQKTLKPAAIDVGDEEGELLVVGWGSTWGAIQEAVQRIRKDGHKVSSLHLKMLSPLEPGIQKIFAKFDKVMTIEINYSDPLGMDDQADRRYAQLALLLRAATCKDVDCWSLVPGAPLPPGLIEQAVRSRLNGGK